MNKTNIKKSRKFLLGSLFVCSVILAVGCSFSVWAQSDQQMFANPEEAVNALKAAVKAKDQTALTAIFGPRIKDFLSGDPVADKNDFEEFAYNIARSSKLESVNGEKVTVLIGTIDWPFAAPIVKVGDKWRFDTNAGVEELIDRRIGENELAAMYLCQTYAIAQYEYFNGDDWDGDQVSEYAQKITSSAGRKDGLYWVNASEDEEESPLGPLFGWAASEGYTAKKGSSESASPFHGYIFKVLYRQGPSAPGGKFDYIINGNMIAGFALVASPAVYGKSGIMTFVINQEGRVYQKNLGPQTPAITAAMTAYDPDETWELVDPDQ